MIISRHDCINKLFELDTPENDNICLPLLSSMLNDPNLIVDSDILSFLLSNNVKLPVVDFYLLLNNKAHPIIKQLLTCDGKEVFYFIKLATSIITQATITLEHQFKDDLVGANQFILYLGLPELSEALGIYFNTGDYASLVNQLEYNKKDVEIILKSSKNNNVQTNTK